MRKFKLFHRCEKTLTDGGLHEFDEWLVIKQCNKLLGHRGECCHVEWIAYIDRKWYRFVHILHDIKWWFLHRFHPRYRYHVIKTELTPGWYDRDKMMAFLMVTMLIDFVEQELNYGYDVDERYDELIQLYRFFKRWSANDVLDFVGTTDHNTYADTTAKLTRLVELRKHMWT